MNILFKFKPTGPTGPKILTFLNDEYLFEPNPPTHHIFSIQNFTGLNTLIKKDATPEELHQLINFYSPDWVHSILIYPTNQFLYNLAISETKLGSVLYEISIYLNYIKTKETKDEAY